MICSKAIVISSVKFQDSSLIVKCYTQQMGMQSYLLKGILKSSKNSLKTAYFQPLTILEIISTDYKKKQLQYIKEAKLLHQYQNLHTDIYKNSVVFFLSEVCHFTIAEELINPELFNFLQAYFQWFDIEKSAPNFHLKFLIDLTQLLGISPDTSSINCSFFDIEEGVFVNQNNGHHLIDAENSNLIKYFLSHSLQECCSLTISRNKRNELLEIILKYYLWHLPNFRTPKSLTILQEILK